MEPTIALDQLDATDPADVARGLAHVGESLPFNRHLGVVAGAVGAGRAEVRLPHDDRLANHIGTVHAIAELAPAEMAAATAASSRLGDLLADGWVPVVKHLAVTYVAPASGTLVAVAEVGQDETDRARAAAAAGERVALEVPVEVRAGDTVVAEVRVELVYKRLGGS